MGLVVGTNSYASLAEADAYLTDRIGATGWFALSDTPSAPGEDSKESMLVSAYYWLTGSSMLDLPATSSSPAIKNAQIEAALYLSEFYLGMKNRRAKIAQGVESFRLGDRQESLSSSPSEIPDHILGLISEFSLLGGGVFNLKGEYDV